MHGLRLSLGLGLTRREGGGFNLSAFMGSQADGLWFDVTKTDRFFQESTGPTLGDDAGEAIGLAMDQRLWSGQTLAGVVAAATEVVANGGFDSDTAWTKGTGWTISGGKASRTSQASSSNLLSDVAVPVSGKTYRVAFTISNYVSGALVADCGGGNAPSASANGSYVYYIAATGANANFKFFASNNFEGSVDDVSVKLVPGNHGVQGTGSLKPLRQAEGAKFDGSDDNWLSPYLLSSTANFVVALVTVPASLAANQIIFGAQDGATNRLTLGIATSGVVRSTWGTASSSLGTTDLRNQEVVVGLSTDGTSILDLYANGALEDSDAFSGTIPNAVACRVAALNNNGTANGFFGGAIKKLVAGREHLTAARYNQIRNALLAA